MGGTSERARYDVERRSYHAERPAFGSRNYRSVQLDACRGTHTLEFADTFYVLAGRVRVNLKNPDEEVVLEAGQVWGPVPAGRPHLVTNAGDTSATFLVLQGLGEYDFIPVA